MVVPRGRLVLFLGTVVHVFGGFPSCLFFVVVFVFSFFSKRFRLRVDLATLTLHISDSPAAVNVQFVMFT